MHVTVPYFGNASPEDVCRSVAFWADKGATSFKAYTSITRAALAAAIEAAHKRGLKVTGHLCAVGFTEAINLGIDSLEHGLVVDSEFNSQKVPDAIWPR
jgi:imidazolonepropionase-like amidohydrolase